MRHKGLIVCAAIGALAWSKDAAAAGARWYVDVAGTKDADCGSERATFEREVTLACAAVGTCHVVERARDAELRATLHCASEGEPWTLELRTVEGMLVSTTELTGAPADRLREAAVEVARDQAPERTLAAASLRDTLGDGDRGPTRTWKPPRASMSLGAAGAFGGVERYSGGARALAGVAIANSTHVTLGLTGLMGGTGSHAARHFRSGAGMAFGAPFDGSFFGVVLEGGLDLSQSYDSGHGYFMTSAETRGGVYGQGAFVLALPLRAIRPYVAFTAGAYSEPKTSVYSSLDAGLAFPLF